MPTPAELDTAPCALTSTTAMAPVPVVVAKMPPDWPATEPRVCTITGPAVAPPVEVAVTPKPPVAVRMLPAAV